MSLYNGEASVVCLSVRLSVNFCANLFFSQANGRIATKLSQDGLQVSVHPWCAQGQGQGQRSRDRMMRALSWILGMSCSVIDGLVLKSDEYWRLMCNVMARIQGETCLTSLPHVGLFVFDMHTRL